MPSIAKSSSAERGWGLALLIALALTLAGCSGEPPRPDLKRLYQAANLVQEQPPLIVIPGIMGSKLRDVSTHRTVWPGGLMRLLFHRYEDVTVDIDPATLTARSGKLEPYELTDTVAGQHFYDTIVSTLVDSGSFVVTQPGTPVKDAFTRHLYLFPYDWRLDNVETARRLAALIDQLRIDYGKPDLKADIVAHSMGGIVSRYLLQFGTEDVLDRDNAPITMAGASRINRLVLLGTPSLGSARIVEQMVEGAKIVFKKIPTDVVATMPSVYQLLPDANHKPLIGLDGRPLLKDVKDDNSPERDIFDVTTWRELQWSVFAPKTVAQMGPDRTALLQKFFERSLQRAERLQQALAREQPASSVKLIVFGADCTLTPSRVVVEADGREMRARFTPAEIKHPVPDRDYDKLIQEPGDGQVTKASLLGRQSLDPTVRVGGGFPIAFSFFLCSEHSSIPGNINFQDNLLNALLAR